MQVIVNLNIHVNDVQLSGMRAVRRIPHHGRSVANPRTRRASNMQYQTPGSTLMVLSPGDRDRDAMDPIAGKIFSVFISVSIMRFSA